MQQTMPEIRPVRAIHFDQDRVEFTQVLAPPYYEVTPEIADGLARRDEFNVVRLIAGFERGWYANAERLFGQWRSSGILVEDDVPALYVLHQTFQRNGQAVTRKGFVGLIALQGHDGAELPSYYETHLQQREDRSRLISATGVYAQQLVCGYRDDKHSLDSLLVLSAHDEPWLQFAFDGVEYRIWRVVNETAIQHTMHYFAETPVAILQGKHLYDAALRSARKPDSSDGKGGDAHRFIPAYFCNTRDGATEVQPVHRAIRLDGTLTRESILAKIYRHFNLHQFSREEGLATLHRDGSHVFLLVFPGVPSCTYAKLKNSDLLGTLLDGLTTDFERSFDVNLVHRYLFEKIFEIPYEGQLYSDAISFSRHEEEIFSFVGSRRSVGVFLKPPLIDRLVEAAHRSVQLPYSTAEIHPGMPSGLFFYSIR